MGGSAAHSQILGCQIFKLVLQKSWLEQYWNTQPWSQCSFCYSSLASHPRLLEWQNLSPPYLREKKTPPNCLCSFIIMFQLFQWRNMCLSPQRFLNLRLAVLNMVSFNGFMSCGLLHIKRKRSPSVESFTWLRENGFGNWMDHPGKAEFTKQIQGEFFTVKPGTSLTDFLDTWHVCCLVV